MREPRSPGHCGDSIAGLRSWDDGVTAQAACRRGRPMADPTTIDEYLTTLPPDRRGPMEEIRRTVRAAAPDATETIAYKMPAFRSRGGRYLVGFDAYKAHYSLFAASGRVLEELGDELAPYLSGRGTIRFPASGPIPLGIVRLVVEIRDAENARRVEPG
ncbi:MAG: DUF1801 domain-containing protein [Chloroflexi bacterium]|nr:MAG: DUF1801 domain-containing protein [Chloroflexota bacterium]